MAMYSYFQLANAYAQSFISYGLDLAPKPFSASFVVSNQCNIHCSYCNFPAMTKAQLSLAQIEVLFEKLKKMGVKRLGLLGGEPLLRKDILAIIGIAKSKGFFISLNTNLLLYDKYKDSLQDVDYFFTSIDGTPEKHIANRGPQKFERILAAIRDIRDRKKIVTAICVATDTDLASAQYLIQLAKENDFLVHFQPECYDTEIVQRSAPIKVESQSIKTFWQFLLEEKRAGAPISSSANYLEYISEWQDYTISSYYDPKDRCAAGRGFLFVDTEGVAYPCAFTKGKMKGINLLEKDWEVEFDKKTPCTKCIVGPMLEFNLLFKKPVSAIVNSIKMM